MRNIGQNFSVFRTPARRRRGRRGMTLIEILVSIAISTILVGAAYSVYAAATSGWNKSQRRIDMHQRARVALNLMARCVRAAHVPDASDQVVFDGTDQLVEGLDADGADVELNQDILLCRTNAPIHLFGDDEIPDQAEVEFYIETTEDEETGRTLSSILYMRVDDTYDLDPYGGGWIVEVADFTREMNITYFSGTEWVDSWTSSDGTPRAVEIALAIQDPGGLENDLVVSRVISIAAWRDSSSGREQDGGDEFSLQGSRAEGALPDGAQGGGRQGGGR